MFILIYPVYIFYLPFDIFLCIIFVNKIFMVGEKNNA